MKMKLWLGSSNMYHPGGDDELQINFAGLNVAHVECFIREIILLLEKRCWMNREAEF